MRIMAVKNKLYKHHKSKLVLVFRNFSISITGLFIIGALAAIPTYIPSNQVEEAEAKEQVQSHQEQDEDKLENIEKILSYKLD